MHVPVIMVTALDQTSDKVQGLEAGADDFLTKPVDDIALITRVKNLTRLKMLNDEMMLRMATGGQTRPLPGAAWRVAEDGKPAAASCWSRTSERVAKRIVARARQVARGATSSPTCRRRCCGLATSATICSSSA